MSKQMEARITPGQNEPRPPFPKQHQEGPGIESKLDPRPRYKAEAYRPAGALERGGRRAGATGDYEAWSPDA